MTWGKLVETILYSPIVSQKKVVLSELCWRKKKSLCSYILCEWRNRAVFKRAPEEPYPFWTPVFQCILTFCQEMKLSATMVPFCKKKHSLWDPTEWSNLCLSWDWNNRHIYSWVTSIHRGQLYNGIMCPVNIHVSTLQRTFLYKFDFLTDDLNSLSHWYISCCSHFQVATSLNPVILSHTAN